MNAQASNSLSKNMKALRQRRGWSQERLAEECALHRTYVGAIERGERNVTIKNIELIAKALNVSVSELLSGGGTGETNGVAHAGLLEALKKVTGKRLRIVIDHILKHGHITTEELETEYGYNHPPRAARDVREAGIPLETFRVRGNHGRMIAAYRFGDPGKVEKHKLGGRRTFSKAFKKDLIERSNSRCEICNSAYPGRYLQIDHCVPYEVSGEQTSNEDSPGMFLLICASCQRSKSWSCERCENWKESKKIATCRRCYWGNPEKYSHIAGKANRRLTLTWSGKEVRKFDELARASRKAGVSVAELVRRLLDQKKLI